MTLLSVITGTYNRIDYLRALVESVRKQIPVGIDYEFVVCDGGSTDGTLEWCKAQPDVVLIEHGELRGALRAFTDAGNAARGDYTILSNDDVVFHESSILPALAYLEAHPTCGGVAFADDRPAPGYASGYKTQTISVRDTDGSAIAAPYIQVGMVRTWLGKRIGWWGADDSVMGQGATYGGDNWLSARIYELGYSIATLDACRVSDRIPADTLREINLHAEQRNPGVYYKAYPQPPQYAGVPQVDNPQSERLRTLYLPLYSPGWGAYKRGLRDALGRVGIVYELDYVRYPRHFAAAVAAFQPHVILTQFHDGDTISGALLAEARSYAPNAVVVNWNGDCYYDNLTSPNMLRLLEHIDLQLVVNASVLPYYEQRGIRAAYWQIGYEPVPDKLPKAPRHDLLFLANAYRPERKALEPLLNELARDVGLYGAGWENARGSTLYDFAAGAALYRNCKIAIGDNMYPNDSAFVSNRFFEALANGAFLLHQHIPDLEQYTGIREGVHFVAWHDTDDLRAKVREYLYNEGKRRAIAEHGKAFVREHFSFDAQVRKLFGELLPTLERERELS